MFECQVYIHLPLDEKPDIEIARYDFDPGLQIGDIVNVTDLVWTKIPDSQTLMYNDSSFSFEAMVKIRKYQIEPRNSKDAVFRVLIGLEMADKEQLSQMAEIIENNSNQS